MGVKIKSRIDSISKDIYELADFEFNISSPSQLGNVLFEKLELPHGKKKKNGYSTDEATLSKLIEYPGISFKLPALFFFFFNWHFKTEFSILKSHRPIV